MSFSSFVAWLAGLSAETWVAIASAVAAVVSFALNLAVVRRQTALQFESLKAQMDADMLAWAHEATDAVSDGLLLARGRGVVFDETAVRARALETSLRLSSLADRGRLFFPNISPHAQGGDKAAAFQGFRPPILDAVVFASAQVARIEPRNLGPDEDAANLLKGCRRLLVSETQGAIDPRRRGQMMRRLALGRRRHAGPDFALAAALGEALEARYPGFLTERRDEAWIAQRQGQATKGQTRGRRA